MPSIKSVWPVIHLAKIDRATMFGAYHLATSISDSAVTASSNYVMLSSASQHLSENLARILEPEEARKVS